MQSIDSDDLGGRPLLRSGFQPSDDAVYREASFARSQDSMTQPVSYSKLAGQSITGRNPAQKSRLAPESSAGDTFGYDVFAVLTMSLRKLSGRVHKCR